MRIFIIEDEDLAVKKIRKTLLSIDPSFEIAGTADSIESAVEWLNSNPQPDLILMDIELSDGQSFQIFNLTEVKSPVIFIQDGVTPILPKLKKKYAPLNLSALLTAAAIRCN